MGEAEDSNNWQRVELGFSDIFCAAPTGCGKTEFDRGFSAAREEKPDIKWPKGLRLRFFGHPRRMPSE
jgi:hypothetical protein